MLYLLQLVQALKFESSASDTRSSRSTASAVSYDDSGLADFLITRAVKNSILEYRLYWYLTVEVALEDRLIGKMYGKVIFNFIKQLLEVQTLLSPFTVLVLSLFYAVRQRSGAQSTPCPPGRAGYFACKTREGVQ